MQEDIEIRINELTKVWEKDFYKRIFPQMKEMKLERLRVVYSGSVLITVLIFITVISAGWKFLINTDNVRFLVCLILLGLVLCFGMFYFFSYEYSSKIKNTFYRKIFKLIGLNWKQGGEKVDYPFLNDCKIFNPATYVDEDDIISGNYKDVKFTIAETDVVDKGGGYAYRYEKGGKTVFSGILVSFLSNKKNNATTIVLPKLKSVTSVFELTSEILFFILFILLFIACYFIHFYGGICAFVFFVFFVWTVAYIRNKVYMKDMQKISLEDVIFSKKYQAYSYEQIECRYLLTTAFIERFLRAGKAFKTTRLRCSFCGDKFVLAIPARKNAFEISGLFMSLNNPKHIHKFFEQIASILLLVDCFKLERKTGL